MAWVLLVALFAAACTGAPAEPSGSPSPPVLPSADVAGDGSGGTLRIGLSSDPVSIDPRFVADAEGELVVGALFEPLVTLDAGLEVASGAAARWDVHEDGRRFVFHLRPADFHDGSPVTADDFVRSFTRLLDGTADPPSHLGYLLEAVEGAADAQQHGGPVAGLRAVDERTLEIRLEQPQPGFLRTLTDPSLVPLPPAADTDLEGFAAQPVGNGPFAMSEPREPGQFLRLTRFDGHHQPPALDEVVLSVYPETDARDRQWADFQAGQLHVAEIPPDHLDAAREEVGASPDGYLGPGLLDGIGATVYLYGFDLDRPPFDDVRVRRAISLAIDREQIAEQVLSGARVGAVGIVPPPVPGSQARACAYCRHDPEQARALWDEVIAERQQAATTGDTDVTESGDDASEAAADADAPTPTAPTPPADNTPTDGAGVPATDDPEPAPTGEGAAAAVPEDLATITLTHNRGRTHTAVAEAMAADIESALDITVRLAALDLPQLLARSREGEAGVFRIGWETNHPSPGAYLTPLFHSRNIGRDNLTGYANDAVDALLDEARGLRPPAAARARYREAERLILDDMPVMPLLWYRDPRVVAPEVEGLRWAPFGRIDLAAVSLAIG